RLLQRAIAAGAADTNRPCRVAEPALAATLLLLVAGELLGRRQRDRTLERLRLLAECLDATTRQVLICVLPGIGVVRGIGVGRDAVRLRHVTAAARAPDADGLVAVVGADLLGLGGSEGTLLRRALLPGYLQAEAGALAATGGAVLVLIGLLRGVGVVRRVRVR